MDKKESDAFANNLDTFSRNFYNLLAESHPDTNLIYSPFSIQAAAAMLRMGAVDGCGTAKQMDTGFMFNSSTAVDIAKSFHNVLNVYGQYSVLQVANKLYVANHFPVRSEFKRTLFDNFNSQPENINFAVIMEAANTINEWVETKTNRCIRNILSPNDLGDNIKLVIVNAIHFKGEWTICFDENQTKYEPFHLASGTKINVAMMNALNHYDYADLQDLDAKSLQIKYRDTSLCMLIILPNKKESLTQLQKGLHWKRLPDITSRLSSQKVSVKLPKFQAEFSLEISELCQRLGITQLFGSQAELHNISDLEKNLGVSKIIHKAFIDVNEKGTEAAAATAAMVFLRSAPPPEEPKCFYADHPFYYIIYDPQYGPLFVGNFSAPAAKADPKSDIHMCPCKDSDCERYKRKFQRS